jgi:hypothetical protein
MSDTATTEFGVPDRFSGNTVEVRHRQNYVVKPNAAGEIVFGCVSTPGGPLMVGRGVFEADLQDLSTLATLPINVDTDSADWTFLGKNMAILPNSEYLGQRNPYEARAFRTAALAMEVKFAGTTLNDNGQIYFTKTALKDLGVAGLKTAPLDATRVDAARVYTAADVINGITQMTAQNRYQQFRPREGGYIVAANSDPDYDFVPINQSSTAYVRQLLSAANPQAELQTLGTLAVDTSLPIGQTLVIKGVEAIGSMESCWFVATGLDATAAFVLRAVHCVEYQVEPTSTISKFTTPSPPEDTVALNVAADVGKVMPVAVPAMNNASGSWGKRVLGYVRSALKVVGATGIPLISQGANFANALWSEVEG